MTLPQPHPASDASTTSAASDASITSGASAASTTSAASDASTASAASLASTRGPDRSGADGVTDGTVRAYLDRIGADRPARADIEALRELQRRHLLSVPFENLSIHLGEDIVLEEQALLDKVIGGRGGFCYELNGAFGALLRALGFRVSLLQARVFGDGGRLGIPYDHMALRVETEDGTGPWLADVGFGDHALRPLALADLTEQEDPRGVFRFRAAPEGDLDLLRGGSRQFRLDLRPRTLTEFRGGAWYHRTSPDSHFTRSLVCSRCTDTGRVTLSRRALITTVGGERHRTELATDEEVLAAYRDHFGLRLSRVPEVRGRFLGDGNSDLR
ncbi:arylamine N-acetyltransferase [Streptomyces sp. C11-1]|uniref:Arylamine N-acetyltransferase n=1 Tax=Streptomyces durocortorensis TaxID=2811104 RepID=A0ABY9VUY6_9ACTN|nr:arylamine N-acetyltransferase [Streptomyces durocortorensis]WNF26969.1 arylamine N-acetyltransferase [Streptomyces durocortorensis]